MLRRGVVQVGPVGHSNKWATVFEVNHSAETISHTIDTDTTAETAPVEGIEAVVKDHKGAHIWLWG